MPEEGKKGNRKVNPIFGILLYGAMIMVIFDMAYQMLYEERFFDFMSFFLMGISILFLGIAMTYVSLDSNRINLLFIAGGVLFSIGGIFWGVSLYGDFPLLAILWLATCVLLLIIILKFGIPSIFNQKKGLVDVMEEKGILPQWNKDQPWSDDSEVQNEKILRIIYIREKKELKGLLDVAKFTMLTISPFVIVFLLFLNTAEEFETKLMFLVIYSIVGLSFVLRLIIQWSRLNKDYQSGKVEVIKGQISQITSYSPLFCSFIVGEYKFWIDGIYGSYLVIGDKAEIVRGQLSKKIIRVRTSKREFYIS
jgi:hypothetical protein